MATRREGEAGRNRGVERTHAEGIQKGDGRGETEDDADDGGDAGRRGAQRGAAHGMAGTTGVRGGGNVRQTEGPTLCPDSKRE